MSREWRSPDLGPAKTLELEAGRLRYHDAGQGPPLVFVHGALVNANLWRKVVARLSGRFRCIALDMPFGSLVGNDTGGAICQLVAVNRPERLGRLVLTSCDSFERFPPAPFGFFKLLAKITPAIPLLFAPLRVRPARRLPIAYGWVTRERIEPREAEDSYVLPLLEDRRIREDLRRLIPGLDKRYTLEAAEGLRSFDKPTLLAWSSEDKLFPRSDAQRLRDTIPDARLEWVEGARTFSPEDQPERVAELIAGFAARDSSSIPQQSSSVRG